MRDYKEGQGCPACNVGRLKIIGGNMETKGKYHVSSLQLECPRCTEKFLDEKKRDKSKVMQKAW